MTPSIWLTNDYKHVDRPHGPLLTHQGIQRLYEFPGGWGLSCVDNPALHSFKFAWEIAVLRHGHLDYSTPLTEDVEVFMSDDEANAFIHKAAKYFEEKGA